MWQTVLGPCVAAGMLLAACEHTSDLTEPPAAVHGLGSPGADLAGAGVSRFTDFVGDFIPDEEAQLSAMIGRSYETVVSVCTGGEDDPDTGLVQLVHLPDGSARVLVRAEDVNVLVWDTVLPPDDCGLFLATPPFATGTARLLVRVGDIVPDDQGAFTFTARYVGTVRSTETGQAYHFLVMGHIVATVSGQVHFSSTGIQLTPIGH